MVKKAGEGGGELFGERAFATLRDSLATFAPDLLGLDPLPATKPAEGAGAKKKKADQFVRETKVKQPHEDDGGSVSSARPRERSGGGFSMHELRAKNNRDPESVIPSEYKGERDESCAIPSEYKGAGDNFNVNDLLEHPGELYVEDADSMKHLDPSDGVSDMLLEDAILDAYRDGMASNYAANETRGFSNELHYWDERYRYDADLRARDDGEADRQRRAESERIANDARRRADEAADRARMDADLARRRYEDDLNRR